MGKFKFEYSFKNIFVYLLIPIYGLKFIQYHVNGRLIIIGSGLLKKILNNR